MKTGQIAETSKHISKELVMEIFRELKRAYFPIQRGLVQTCKAVAQANGIHELPNEVKFQLLQTSTLISLPLILFNA